MSARVERQHDYEAARALYETLSGEWRQLCARYLPVTAEGAIWKYSREPAPGDPVQGWKLHVSATILTASKAFRAVAPFLQSRGVLFKAPSSLFELDKINCGLHYGYSQVGKFITVYPHSAEEATSLARYLDQLTDGMSAPSVPFDLRFRPGSCVYYRYGSFRSAEIENPDGTRTPAMCDPEGNLVPDLRESMTAKPDWVADPFIFKQRPAASALDDSPLKTTYRAFRALTQRGKGGVYKAFDLSTRPPRLCILKEGRRAGEVQWDGRDGHWRVRHEESVLGSLRAAGIAVPRIYSSFEAEGNYYLVTEFVEGESLQSLLDGRHRRFSVRRVLQLGAKLAAVLASIHSAGWAWRDCKPANVMVTKGGDFRPLDFEGACPVERPDPVPWATRPFAPPESEPSGSRQSGVHDDLYALGVIIYLLLAGELPVNLSTPYLKRLRRDFNSHLCDLISELLNADPLQRPTAPSVVQRLRACSTSAYRPPKLAPLPAKHLPS